MGSASVGWAMISETEVNGTISREILGLGSRIIPYEGTEGKDFEKGTGESRNSIRTRMRTMRKGYDRYQLRRKYLVQELIKHSMLPSEELRRLPKMQLWELRSRAVEQKVTLEELGRILLWLNQKRGYKSSRSEANKDKKDTEYVATVKSRHALIKEQGITIGQFFYQNLLENEYYRVKENIFPREAYIEEFDAICAQQQKYYPEILTEGVVAKIRNEIIYYQRPLKSQKGLVSICEFEGQWCKGKDGKEYFVGPKVAPRSSPISQLSKIWESINNLTIENKYGNPVELSLDDKKALFNYLDNNEKLKQGDIERILGLKKNEYIFSKQVSNGLKGNTTKVAIKNCLGDAPEYEHLLQFNVAITEKQMIDKKTGEVFTDTPIRYVNPSIEKEPLYLLWHVIYSINDIEECSSVIQRKFNLEKGIADRLAQLDFTKGGFGNKSAKAIRKILPYLMEGFKYSDAMRYAGYDHSNSLTKEENLRRTLLDKLKPIPKNSLRQPIVEKILNQMVNVVNAIIDKYGKPDEIRVELARELKQSKEERNNTFKNINEKERENDKIRKKLAEFGLRATRNNIIKCRLYDEMDNEEKKLNAICVYCGQTISFIEAIKGEEIDVEHIIPKSKLFDDSQSNKTLAHRRCNSTKGDLTAYDFMKGKPEHEFLAFIERVKTLYDKKVISKAKRDKLLMTESKIPQNFIDRQLRESQYIARKSRELLQTICHNVWSTSGSVTAELRRLWGWDDVTMNLQLPKYKELGLTEMVDWESEHGRNKHSKEVIKGWTKRDDHRHHAIDALTIACTKQGYIQRFNTLSSSKTREDIKREVESRSVEYRDKLNLLEKYIIGEQPFTVRQVEEKVANILVSFKSGKKVAVFGKRKIGRRGNRKVVQTGIIVPRGALSEESVYGKIKVLERNKPLKYLFERPELIVNPVIKAMVAERLGEFAGDSKKALASIKKKPLYLDPEKKAVLEFASCFTNEYVIKYSVDPNFSKVDKVVDPKVKSILQNRLAKFYGRPKEAFKDVVRDGRTIRWYEDEVLPRPIKSVRCYTGLSAVVPVKKDQNGNSIGFVKPGNNHHIAIYTDAHGNKQEHICTFWHAVERKKYGLPVVIQNTNEVWDRVEHLPEGTYPDEFLEKLPAPNLKLDLSMQQNEMFILGMLPEEASRCISSKDYKTISDRLYRVQKLSEKNYVFRHHLETQLIDNDDSKKSNRYYLLQSIGALFILNPIKVKIDCIGNIILS